MNYTIYKNSTGEIEKVVSCDKSQLSIQFDPQTHSYLEGSFDDLLNYVNAGQVVPKPKKPTQHHTFDYTTKQWVDPRTPETEWPLVRAKRDRLIAATDWTQLPDVPLTTKEVWANYRQALRDVTLQADPFNIVWPVAP